MMADRKTTELMGIAHGVLADGVLCDREIAYLQTWLASNSEIRENIVAFEISRRVDEICEGGAVDEGKRSELIALLRRFLGGEIELGEIPTSSGLPLCEPAPSVQISGMRYCFTGTFNFGNRGQCEGTVQELGGQAGPLRATTNYLVIGTYVTPAWRQEKFGRKIEKAMAFRAKGHSVSIISEHHWAQALKALGVPVVS